MIDPNEQEIVAIRAAGDIAGRYIEAVGRTDMASWPEAEWHGFIEAICGAYVDALVEQQIAINLAVSKVQGLPA